MMPPAHLGRAKLGQVRVNRSVELDFTSVLEEMQAILVVAAAWLAVVEMALVEDEDHPETVSRLTRGVKLLTTKANNPRCMNLR